MAIYVRDEKGVLQALDIPAYKGEKGEAGITPNLQVGDVVTLESGQQATIVRRGDDENPIFDFAIPKGDDGKDGIFVGRVDDAPDHAQVVVNDDASPYDLFFENANVSYMGDTYTSLKEKADADIEYLLREIQTQHYEGSNITATDTYQKQVRSAILKGNTLLVDELGNECEIPNSPKITMGAWINTNTGVETASVTSFNTGFLKCPTVPFVVKGNNKYKRIVFYDENKTFISGIDTKVSNNSDVTIASTKIPSNAFYLRISASSNTEGVSYTPDTKLLIEDVSGNNLYSTQLVSVKMPVLKTTGKNLFDPYSPFDTDYYGSEGWCLSCHYDHEKKLIITEGVSGQKNSQFPFLKFKPNTTYTFSGNVVGHQQRFCIHNESKQIEFNGTGHFSLTATTGDNGKLYVSILKVGTPNGVYGIENLQIKEGSTATSYEPHKSNILSTPQDLVLRGIGDVRDTLDSMTGKVTARIQEIVLDGSENWVISHYITGYTMFRYIVPNLPTNTSIRIGSMLCDKFNVENYINTQAQTREFITIRNGTTGQLLLNVSNEKANEVTVLREWLSQNPITVQYQRATESIKTVDLNNQKVYSYDGTTHYTTSSGVEGHPAPILSIDVPTNLPALVSRQRDTIKDLEKENEALKEEVAVVDQQRESGDLELLSSDFDLDFRLMEIEFALDIPIAATFKEVRNMARTPYEMAKILILGGKYERSDMEYKLGRYLERKQITQAQYDELIALMEANELVV